MKRNNIFNLNIKILKKVKYQKDKGKVFQIESPKKLQLWVLYLLILDNKNNRYLHVDP